MAGIFDRLFRRTKEPAKTERAELLSTSTAILTPWSGDAYANDIYRGAVDAIARNAAKLKGSHIIHYTDRNEAAKNSRINRLLQTQPNPYMSAFDMLYKMVTHYFLYNNAFAFLQKDDRGQLIGIFPLRALHVDFLSDGSGELYCKFLFSNSREITLPYVDIIHLRRNFNNNDLLGDPNTALSPALELAHTQNEGYINGIKSSANIRGILKFTQIMAPEKLKEEKERFINDYLSIANDGGIVATDQKMEYVPIDIKPAVIDDKQIQAISKKIYDYLGISENIVNSSYTEDEWAAFYESTLEPIAVQMSLEFTRKLFNEREQAFGNSIIFESGRLQFASNATKAELITNLLPMGILSINEAREILNLPSIDDGHKYIQSLNYVNKDIADQYQLKENKKGASNSNE
jgi:HK97 family phage portal protein